MRLTTIALALVVITSVAYVLACRTIGVDLYGF